MTQMKRQGGLSTSGFKAKRLKETNNVKYVFVTVAGAFGKLPQGDDVNIKNIVSKIGPGVTVLEPVKSIHSKDIAGNPNLLRGGSGCTIKTLESVRHYLFAAEANYPAAKVFLVSQSFGGRASVHTILQRYEDKRKNAKEPYPAWEDAPLPAFPKNFSGMILCGYPIQHPKQDRNLPLVLLSELKEKVKVAFIAGTSDGGCGRGELLENTVLTMKKNMGAEYCQIHFIDGGGHNPFDSKPKSLKQEKIDAATQFIKDFIGYT